GGQGRQPGVAALGVLDELGRILLVFLREPVLPDIGRLQDVTVGVDDAVLGHSGGLPCGARLGTMPPQASLTRASGRREGRWAKHFSPARVSSTSPASRRRWRAGSRPTWVPT